MCIGSIVAAFVFTPSQPYSRSAFTNSLSNCYNKCQFITEFNLMRQIRSVYRLGRFVLHPGTLRHVHHSRRIRLLAQFQNSTTSRVYGYHLGLGFSRRPLLLLLGGIYKELFIIGLQINDVRPNIEILYTWMAVPVDMAAHQPHPPGPSSVSEDRKRVEIQTGLAQNG